MSTKKQILQEEEYIFPYHYLFKRKLHRGIHYFSYIDMIISLLNRYKIKRNILDLGCGDGRAALELSKNFKDVKGIDYSEKAIAFAKAFSSKVDYKVLNILKENIQDKFDAVVCIEVIEHIDPSSLKRFIRKIVPFLKKNGILIITTPTPNMRMIEKHYQHFTKEKIDSYLPYEFEFLEDVYQTNKYWDKLFILLRGLLHTRFHSINFRLPNYLLYLFFKFLVEKANAKTGERIIYVCKRK